MNKRSGPKFTRAMLVLLPLTTEFAQRGGDVEALLLRHKIPLAALTTPTMLVDASACYAAMEDMAETLGDVHFGAKVATEAANKGAPAIWNAAKNAVTLGDFLARIVVEIATQVDNVRYLFSASADAASFEVQRTLRVSGPTTQLDAIGVVFYVSLIKRGLGKTFDPKHIIVTAPTNAGFPPGFLPKSLSSSPTSMACEFLSRRSGSRSRFHPAGTWLRLRGGNSHAMVATTVQRLPIFVAC
jgi:hypothetical protein